MLFSNQLHRLWICPLVKESFQPVNTGLGTHLPLETNGPDSFFCCMGLATHLPQQVCYLPSIVGTHFSPGSREVIIGKYLTQGHNTLTVTGLKPTTFCLWTQHWSARPHMPTLRDRSLICRNFGLTTFSWPQLKLYHFYCYKTLGWGLFVGLVTESCGRIWLPCLTKSKWPKSWCYSGIFSNDTRHDEIWANSSSLATQLWNWSSNLTAI